jgi:hypothetical protein
MLWSLTPRVALVRASARAAPLNPLLYALLSARPKRWAIVLSAIRLANSSALLEGDDRPRMSLAVLPITLAGTRPCLRWYVYYRLGRDAGAIL